MPNGVRPGLLPREPEETFGSEEWEWKESNGCGREIEIEIGGPLLPVPVLEPNDPPLERRTLGRTGGLPSKPNPLSSKPSGDGEEERGDVGEEAVLLVAVPVLLSGVAPPGVLWEESTSVLDFLKMCKSEYLEPRRREWE